MGKPIIIYRMLLLGFAVYFAAVALAHQAGMKIPLLYIFFDVPSERYQDLIISFLSFGWSMLFYIGSRDAELKAGIQAPILCAAGLALAGLVRARLAVEGHNEIDYEIAGLTLLFVCPITTYRPTSSSLFLC